MMFDQYSASVGILMLQCQ